jgi:hypothetical protein
VLASRPTTEGDGGTALGAPIYKNALRRKIYRATPGLGKGTLAEGGIRRFLTDKYTAHHLELERGNSSTCEPPLTEKVHGSELENTLLSDPMNCFPLPRALALFARMVSLCYHHASMIEH